MSSNNKVLFVIYQTGVKGNGGVQSVTKIIEGVSKDLEIHVFTQLKTPYNALWSKVGAKVALLQFPSSNPLFKIVFYLVNNLRTFFYCLYNNIRVVHCNDIIALVNTSIGARFAGSRVIYNVRAVKPPGETYSFLWKLGLPFVNHTIVLSDDMSKRLVDHHPSLINNISFEYSVVDFDLFKPIEDKRRLREKLGLPTDKILIGIVGRFEKVKQQAEFIKHTFKTLVKKYPGINLVLIGDFNPSTNLKALECETIVKENNLEESVLFFDFKQNIGEWYAAFDITVVASTEEGLARCMIESMSCGVPVVSFDVSSAREILEKHQCGFVANLNDFDTLSNHIESLILDEKLRLGFGERASKKSREIFDKERVVATYKKLYTSCDFG